jgi:carboxyl-terminal processing protease
MTKELQRNNLKNKSNIISRFGLIFIVVIAFALGYVGGQNNLIVNKPSSFINNNVGQPKSVDFSLFWDTYQTIQKNSLNKLDTQKALDGAIKGMVNALGDPFSVYMTKSESADFLNELDNKFQGIGAELTLQDNIITIVSPIPGSPADKAGLKPKDQILAIDGKETKDMPLGDAVNAIRGDEGTKVELTVLTQGQEVRKVTITRQSIKADSVTMSTVGDKIALVRINQFSDDTTSLMNKFAAQIIKDKDKGVILDLRNNPGGLLDSSVSVSSLFLDNKSVVIEEDKDKNKQELKTDQKAILKDMPLAILVNGGSASASEILSGAMQDNDRAKIVGETTYGKGTVQELIPVKGGGTLRLTIAQWLTPKGRVINHEGIKPDINSSDDPKTQQDEVVLKALSILGQ